MHYREHRCPHCGRTSGLYTKVVYQDVKRFYNFDGEYVEENFDTAYTTGGKNMYCEVCDKFVCKTVDFNDKFRCV